MSEQRGHQILERPFNDFYRNNWGNVEWSETLRMCKSKAVSNVNMSNPSNQHAWVDHHKTLEHLEDWVILLMLLNRCCWDFE